MRRAVLLGTGDTKRTIYFEKAAAQLGLPFLFVSWEDWRRHGFFAGEPDQELFVKVDPPAWESGRIEELDGLSRGYLEELKALESLGKDRGVKYLNPPQDIAALLDKRSCKRKLTEAGIPVTKELLWKAGAEVREAGRVNGGAESLLTNMKNRRVFQVFIKPVRGSGAAGVTAFRLQPHTGKMVLYTCAALTETEDGIGLVNTKRLNELRNEREIRSYLNRLLAVDCIVERWYAKAEYGAYQYDLRAVWQEGRLDFLLARLSRGPVTNLHLNNRPLPADELKLPKSVLRQIGELCRRAAGCFPRLGSAGIDILLEKGSLRPRIIEMNGQGDLLYQDIYEENKIYLHQAALMKRWLEDGGDR